MRGHADPGTTCILYFGSSKDATSVSKLSTAPGMKQAAHQASIQNANSIERTVSPSRYQNHHEGIIGPTGQPWASLNFQVMECARVRQRRALIGWIEALLGPCEPQRHLQRGGCAIQRRRTFGSHHGCWEVVQQESKASSTFVESVESSGAEASDLRADVVAPG